MIEDGDAVLDVRVLHQLTDDDLDLHKALRLVLGQVTVLLLHARFGDAVLEQLMTQIEAELGLGVALFADQLLERLGVA